MVTQAARRDGWGGECVAPDAHYPSTATRVSKAVGMEMGHSKCAVAHLRRGRPAAVHIETGEIPRLHATSDTYQYLGFPQVYGALKQTAIKEFLQSVKVIWSSALNLQNKIRTYNWGPVGRLRYWPLGCGRSET